MLYISYIIYFRPFTQKDLNIIDIFNESIVLMMTYHFLLFTDYLDDDVLARKVGYSVVGLLTLNISVNTLLLL